MANLYILIANLMASIEALDNTREKSLALTKLDECKMWIEAYEKRFS